MGRPNDRHESAVGTRQSFRVSRRFAAFAFGLIKSKDYEAIRENYKILQPFDKAVGYALFALGDPESGSPKTVEIRDILETIAVARGPNGRFNGNHYKSLRSSIQKLRRLDIVLPGEPPVANTILSHLEPLYRDAGYYRAADPSSPGRYVTNIALHRTDSGRNARLAEDFDPEREIIGEVFQARVGGQLRAAPIAAYSFVFSRPIRDDVTLQPGNGGFVTIFNGPQFFRALAVLRKANSQVALSLLELIGSDIISSRAGYDILQKPAEFVYRALGFPPAERRHAAERVQGALSLLADLGVIDQDSDLLPRRLIRGPSYVWYRSPEWRFRKDLTRDEFQ